MHAVIQVVVESCFIVDCRAKQVCAGIVRVRWSRRGDCCKVEWRNHTNRHYKPQQGMYTYSRAFMLQLLPHDAKIAWTRHCVLRI